MEILASCDSDARINIHDLHIGRSSTEVRLSIEILMEDIKTEVSETLEFENRDKSKTSAFVEILDDQELDTWMKTNGFLINTCSTSIEFFDQDLMEKIQPVFAEKKV